MLAAVLGLVVALVLVAVGVHVGSLLVARTRASTAADHAALAAAGATADPDRDPGTAARLVAEANGARVVRCNCATLPVIVTVAVDVPTPLGRLPETATTVQATGRAGLVPATGPGSRPPGWRRSTSIVAASPWD